MTRQELEAARTETAEGIIAVVARLASARPLLTICQRLMISEALRDAADSTVANWYLRIRTRRSCPSPRRCGGWFRSSFETACSCSGWRNESFMSGEIMADMKVQPKEVAGATHPFDTVGQCATSPRLARPERAAS
jgi:hypothetical protein